MCVFLNRLRVSTDNSFLITDEMCEDVTVTVGVLQVRRKHFILLITHFLAKGMRLHTFTAEPSVCVRARLQRCVCVCVLMCLCGCECVFL